MPTRPYHPFTLRQHQVPEPPVGGTWTDYLRWMVVVMNPEDPQLHFVASVFSYSLRYGQLSPKQAEAAQRALERILTAYKDGELRCQGPDRPAPPSRQTMIDHQEEQT